jgi:hypothetical protein
LHVLYKRERRVVTINKFFPKLELEPSVTMIDNGIQWSDVFLLNDSLVCLGVLFNSISLSLQFEQQVKVFIFFKTLFCCFLIAFNEKSPKVQCSLKSLHRHRLKGSRGQDPPSHAVREVRQWTDPPNFEMKNYPCLVRERFVPKYF